MVIGKSLNCLRVGRQMEVRFNDFSQKYSADYDETFSPVVRFQSIRTVIAQAVEKGLELHQMDENTAFLQGELEEEVYMRNLTFSL